MMRFIGVAILTASITISLAAACLAGDDYAFTDLGILPGNHYSSYAYGVNNSGDVAGYSPNSACIWRYGQPPENLSAIGSAGWGEARDINNAGRVVGSDGMNAAYWEGGTVTLIGALGGTWSHAYAVNQNGAITGQASAGSQGNHAYYWDGTMHDLGTLGGDYSWGYGINDLGHVVGSARRNPTGSAEDVACIWRNGGIEEIGSLGSIPWSQALDINNADMVVGVSQSDAGGQAAFFWQDGVLQELDSLGGVSDYAYGINNSGQIVGTSDGHACIWENGSIFDLNVYVPPEYTGWDLWKAYEISDNGYITGWGQTQDGEYHAFLLSPQGGVVPEPATMALFGLGIAGLAARKRRK